MVENVENGPKTLGPGGALGAAGAGRSLVGWATVMALALTGLAVLGFLWLRNERAAGLVRPPAEELRLRLDLNAASAEQFDLIPGVGASRAAKLIEARAARGGFKRLSELDEPGLLGPGASKRLAPYFLPLPGDRP